MTFHLSIFSRFFLPKGEAGPAWASGSERSLSKSGGPARLETDLRQWGDRYQRLDPRVATTSYTHGCSEAYEFFLASPFNGTQKSADARRYSAGETVQTGEDNEIGTSIPH